MSFYKTDPLDYFLIRLGLQNSDDLLFAEPAAFIFQL
jgi:hypothetical protein